MVPVEDVVVEDHHPFVAGKHNHLNFLEDPNNPGKMAEVDGNPDILLLDPVMHQFVDFVKVVTGVRAVRLNFKFVQGCQVHSVEKTLDSSQLLLQPILVESSVVNLLQKVVSSSVPQPKDVFVLQVVFPCNQFFSDNLRKEVIVVVVVEFVAEDVAVVVAAAHCHVSCSDDETADLENQCHGQSQCFRQLAPYWSVEVQKAEIEHSETQKDESPLMK
jgi:hypothetical protein